MWCACLDSDIWWLTDTPGRHQRRCYQRYSHQYHTEWFGRNDRTRGELNTQLVEPKWQTEKRSSDVEQHLHLVSRLRHGGNIMERKTETFWSKTNIVFFLSPTKHFLSFFYTVDVEFVSRLGLDSRAVIKFRHQLLCRVSKKNYVCFLWKRFGFFFQNIFVRSQFWH